MNQLEINATIKLMKEQKLLPNNYVAAVEVNNLIAHVYDVCARNGVGLATIRREIAALLRDLVRRNRLSDKVRI